MMTAAHETPARKLSKNASLRERMKNRKTPTRVRFAEPTTPATPADEDDSHRMSLPSAGSELINLSSSTWAGELEEMYEHLKENGAENISLSDSMVMQMLLEEPGSATTPVPISLLSPDDSQRTPFSPTHPVPTPRMLLQTWSQQQPVAVKSLPVVNDSSGTSPLLQTAAGVKTLPHDGDGDDDDSQPSSGVSKEASLSSTDQGDEQTQVSSLLGPESQALPDPTPTTMAPAFNTFRQNATHMALTESETYIHRIHELEDELARHRVSEDERRETLEKEVRFADQTCVEMAVDKQALEKEVMLLREQLDATREMALRSTQQDDNRLAEMERRCKQQEETIVTMQQRVAASECTKQELACCKDESRFLRTQIGELESGLEAGDTLRQELSTKDQEIYELRQKLQASEIESSQVRQDYQGREKALCTLLSSLESRFQLQCDRLEFRLSEKAQQLQGRLGRIHDTFQTIQDAIEFENASSTDSEASVAENPESPGAFSGTYYSVVSTNTQRAQTPNTTRSKASETMSTLTRGSQLFGEASMGENDTGSSEAVLLSKVSESFDSSDERPRMVPLTELQTIQAEKAQAEGKRQQAEDKVKELEEEMNHKLHELSEELKVNTRLTRVVDQLTREQTDLMSRCRDLEKELQSFRFSKQQSADTEKMVQVLKEELRVSERICGEIKGAKEALEQKLADTQVELEKRSKVILSLEQVNADNAQQLLSNKRDVSALKESSANLADHFEGLVSKMKLEFKENLSKKDEELKADQNAKKAAQKVASEARDTVSRYSQELVATRRHRDSLQAETSQLHQMLEVVKKTSSTTEERLLDVQGKLEQVLVHHNSLVEEKRIIQQDLEKTESEMRSIQSAWKEERNQYEQTVQEMNQDVEKLRREHEEEMKTLKRDQERGQSSRAEMDEALKGLVESEKRALELQQYLQEKEESISKLMSENASTEHKCQRLRSHVRKMEQKCDDWELFCEKQDQFLRKIKDANGRTRKSAAQLARRFYRKEQVHSEERIIWTAERSNLQFIHAQLENELDEIARELSDVVPRPV